MNNDKLKSFLAVILIVSLLLLIWIIVWAVIISNFSSEDKFEFFVKDNKKGITVVMPQSNSFISSPLKITGYVNGGGWIGFEGQTGTVTLIDENNQELAFSILTAKTSWTNPPINFEAVLEFNNPGPENGFLVFRNENPSGLSENDREFRLPIKFSKGSGETMVVKLYFNNNNLDPEFSCNKVFPVERTIEKTEAVARAALVELLKGPAEQEKSQGFFTNINSGVGIQSLTIKDGVLSVDFNQQLEYQVGGSCRVAAIRAQITETLKQFPTVEEVVISIDGRTEDILQP
ncbi:MAG: GerMN domain-containing protein [Candidatus Pacebacteria bacterium]|nr:GerMN domain-containing protein [Candidatus Paceibacterota bacterium]